MQERVVNGARKIARKLQVGAALLCLSAPAVGKAAGIEDTVTGAESLGRAASFGRVHDFLAVVENPANLALVKPHIGGELRFPWLRACYDRAADANVEYRQTPDGSQFLEHFSEVCNEAFSLPTGNLGWASSYGNWGMGLGFYTPAAVGNYKYGTDTLITFQPDEDEPYSPTLEGLESPNRQMGTSRLGLTGFVMGGFGAAPNEHLRLGVSAGVGMVQVNNKTVVSAVGGTFNDQQVISEIHATDWLVGRAVGSVVITPVPGFELFSVFQYHGDAKAKGKMDLTANGIKGVPKKDCVQPDGGKPGSHCTIDGVTVDVPFAPVEATVGLRYAMLRDGHGPQHFDPLENEVFDIELDVAYAKTSNVDAFTVTIFTPDPEKPETFPRIQLGNGANAGELFVRDKTSVPKNWRDTWTLRLGGDINLVPGRFAVRGGVSYATSAVRDGYMNIDFWPVRKIGMHLGMTLKLGERLLWHVGYAHLFYESVTVEVGEGRVLDIASNQQNLATAVNEGTYNATQDIFSSQINILF